MKTIKILGTNYRIEYKTRKEAVEARNKFIDDNNLVYHQKNIYIGELRDGK